MYPSASRLHHDLGSLRLAASQIVIAHRTAKPVPGLPPMTTRDRDRAAALARAFELRDQLAREPKRFEALAASESDEPVTAAMGGSLGVFSPYDVPETIMNALGHLRVGEISRVVETEQGFHVLRRDAVPPDANIALSHVVIKHGGVSGWWRQDRPTRERSREEARAIAGDVARRARGASAEAFAALAREWSDADDALRGGDMGVWSRYERTASDYLLFEAASRLAPDAVSDVVETASGFHVLRRDPLRERHALAASVIAIAYAGSQLHRIQPDPTRDKPQAERIAGQLLEKLRRRPDEFEQRRLEYCELIYCEGPLAWRDGRGLPALETAVNALAVGAISPLAIDSPVGLLVVRREDPSRVPLPAADPVTFEFPIEGWDEERRPVTDAQESATPAGGASSPIESALEYVTSLETHLRGRLPLKRRERGELAAVFARLRERLRTSPEDDIDIEFGRAEIELQRVLDDDAYEELVRQRRVFSAGPPH